jgi:DNA-binding response OmpR family regulator
MMVLLVEDDADLRGMLEGMLPEFEVRGCATGTEGLNVLHTERVDVLLTDLELPGVSGEELARVARALPRPVTVVIMSGNLARLEASRALADAVVVKPFPMAAVRSALMRAARCRTWGGAMAGAAVALALVASRFPR